MPEAVEALMAEDAVELDGQTTGSQHRMEAIAEQARLSEEREERDDRPSWKPRPERTLKTKQGLLKATK